MIKQMKLSLTRKTKSPYNKKLNNRINRFNTNIDNKNFKKKHHFDLTLKKKDSIIISSEISDVNLNYSLKLNKNNFKSFIPENESNLSFNRIMFIFFVRLSLRTHEHFLI